MLAGGYDGYHGGGVGCSHTRSGVPVQHTRSCELGTQCGHYDRGAVYHCSAHSRDSCDEEVCKLGQYR